MFDKAHSYGNPSGPPAEWDRRTFLKASGLTVGGISLAALIAACGGGGGSGSDTLTLRMPFLADMQVPDPDIMYEGEGVQVMESAYERQTAEWGHSRFRFVKDVKTMRTETMHRKR